jgi:hypothetical protein
VEKIRFSLKTLKRTYGFKTKRIVQSITVDVWPELERTVQSVKGNFIFTSRLIALVSLF